MNTARTIRRGMVVIAVAVLCALIALPAYAAYEDSLIAYWKFDSSSGTTAFDEKSANNGTVVGTSTWMAAKFGGGLNFSGGEKLVGYSDVTIAMSSATSPSPNVVTSYRDNNPTYPNWGAFDHSYTWTGAWASNDNGWIQFNLGSGNNQVVTQYKVTANQFGYANVKNWRVYGSTDANSWALLDSKSNYSSWSVGQTRTFDISNINAYQYYRFYSDESTAAGDWMTIGELQYMKSVYEGSDNYITVSDSSALSPTNQVTMSAWINPDAITGARRDVIYANPGYFLGINANGNVTSYVNIGGSWYQAEQDTGPTIQLNQWSLLSATYDGSTLTTYLNGSPVRTLSVSGALSDPTVFAIGSNTSYSGEFFDGKIDDTAIWSRSLSSEEIKSIYRFGTEAFENNVSTWNSTGTTEWSTGWSATGVSMALKDAYVNSGTAVVSTAGDAAKDLYVGYTTGDSGAVSITTGDLTAANEYIGRTGTGSVTQTGGTNTISDTLYIGQNSGSIGTYNLQGGVLKAHAITLGSGTSSFNFTGGTLKIYTFTGDLVIGANAEIAPGSSPGTADVYGDFTLNGTYLAELGGLTPGTEYDQIVVHGGNITLGSDSIIELAAWNSFVPEIGDTFILMDWDEGYTFTDNGYEFDPGTYDLPSYWTLVVNGTQFEATYTGSPVPEPGCALGLFLGFFVPGLRKVLKRKV